MNYIHGLYFFMRKRTIRNVKLGQKIMQTVTLYDHRGKVVGSTVYKWIVTAIYPFFVRVRRYNNEGGIVMDTFNLGELVQLGYEPKGEPQW